MKLDYVSDHLKAVSSHLKEFRHGGIVLSGEELECFIDRIDSMASMAVDLENALSCTEWNRRAIADMVAAQSEQSTAVMIAMRSEDSNVVAFPSRPRGRQVDGGDAA